MPHSLINISVISYLRYAHGLYNAFVILLFLYQALLGLKIRKERIKGRPPTVKFIKRHRKLGPILVFVGIAGFFVGVILMYFDEGKISVYPLHFITGFIISFLVIITFLISNRIKGRELQWRKLHFIIGVTIICLYVFQAFLGIGMPF